MSATDRELLLRDMARLGATYGASVAVVSESARVFVEAFREAAERVRAQLRAARLERAAETPDARRERLAVRAYEERVARERRTGLAYVDQVVRQARLELGLPLEEKVTRS